MLSGIGTQVQDFADKVRSYGPARDVGRITFDVMRRLTWVAMHFEPGQGSEGSRGVTAYNRERLYALRDGPAQSTSVQAITSASSRPPTAG